MFVGSFDLAGAEAVCADAELPELAILDLLDRLVEHSLVESLEGERVGRFSMLETVRQFCHHRLDQEGSLRHWRQRHAEYYAGIAKGVGPMTEASPVLTILSPEDHRNGGPRLRAAGVPVPGVVLSI